MRQIDFAVFHLFRYLREKGADAVGVRRLHYNIVSQPEADRMMPAKGGGVRPYENTLADYNRLVTLIADARIRGLIPFSSIIDEKNGEPVFMPARSDFDGWIEPVLPDAGALPDLQIVDEMPTWREFVEAIEFSPHVETVPTFAHQPRRIVVAIEKATSRGALETLCQYHGADLLVFSGQFSLTRVHDVVNRAKAEDKPIALLYISDLDCGGWSMAPAFMRRIDQVYPRADHLLERVALTRDQVDRFDLPQAFDPSAKGYTQTQIDRFVDESGGRSCVELDALDESVLLDLLGRALSRHSYRELDHTAEREARRRLWEEAAELYRTVDLSRFRTDYEAVATEHNRIADEVRTFADGIGEKAAAVERWRADVLSRIFSDMCVTCGVGVVAE
ncbi:MAG: hypothetical protein ABFC89_00615 [Methanospirillum sp.]